MANTKAFSNDRWQVLEGRDEKTFKIATIAHEKLTPPAIEP